MLKPDYFNNEALFKRYARYLDRASEAFEAGFNSAAAKKEANSALNRAYEVIRDHYNALIHANFHKGVGKDLDPKKDLEAYNEAWSANLDAFVDLPFDLHNVREKKHYADIERLGGEEMVAAVKELVELRAAVKEADVVKLEKKVDALNEELEEAFKEIGEEANPAEAFEKVARKRAGSEPDDGFRSRHALGMSVHGVENAHGTYFLRRMFYLDGYRIAMRDAFNKISVDRNLWEANGAPNMKGWGWKEIRDWYEGKEA